MPTKNKVSVRWQILFSVIFPINLWAFYRIKKLRKFLLYVIVGSIAASYAVGLVPELGYVVGVNAGLISMEEYMDAHKPEPSISETIESTYERDHSMVEHWIYFNAENVQRQLDPANFKITPNTIVSIGFVVFGAYLSVRWSRQWNEKNS